MKKSTKMDQKRIAAALKAHNIAAQKAADKARELQAAALEQENKEAVAVAWKAANAHSEAKAKLTKAWWEFWK